MKLLGINIGRIRNATPPAVPEGAKPPGGPVYRIFRWGGTATKSKKWVNEDSAKAIATAYRCANTMADDVGMMPLQVYNRYRDQITRIYPDPVTRNHAFLLEKQPNRWMTPFIWKRTVMNWLNWWGNAFIWDPPSNYRELFILDASKTYPEFDEEGNKWYLTTFPDGSRQRIPDVEITHLMINSKDGLTGLSVLEYARETIGRQIAAHETQDSIAGNGLQPVAAIALETNGKPLSQEAREIARKSYIDAVDGGVAVFDGVIKGFETITMKPTDAQFLEGIAATDADIANFFNFPLHKLNMGKQSYESNEQQELNYIKSCLNPFLIQIEQAGGLKWVPVADQPFVYLKFNRDSLLQTDAWTRAQTLEKRIFSGQLTPNEARQIEDMASYSGGDRYYVPANMMPVNTVQPAGGGNGSNTGA